MDEQIVLLFVLIDDFLKAYEHILRTRNDR